jgi:ribose transport system substrate-binding protein
MEEEMVRSTFRIAAALSLVVASLAFAACGSDNSDAESTSGSGSQSGATASAEGAKFGAIVLTKQGEFYLAYERAMKAVAKEAGADLTLLDSDTRVEKQQENMENLLTTGTDAIALSPVDAASAAPLIKQAEAQDAKVVTVTVPTDGVPVVVEDALAAGRQGGVAAARYFKRAFPGTPINIAIVGFPQLQQTVDRADGFVAGVRSVDPSARVVVSQDGGAVLDKATTTAENMLQAHPEANVWFGINDDSALGALNALKGAGRGTVKDRELVVGFDGSAKAIQELLDPGSALKVEVGNEPRSYAELAFEAMVKLNAGEQVTERNVVPVTLLTPAMREAELRDYYRTQWSAELP